MAGLGEGMNLKRKQRFEPRIYDEIGNYAVYDLLKDQWYLVNDKPILDFHKAEIEERCQNLQRLFEFANPLPFLDEEMSGPDFMDSDYIFNKTE